MANKGGLEGIVVADIATSYIDGSIGILSYGGYAIEDVAEHATFEEVTFLLLNGRVPSQDEHEHIRATIAENAAIPDELVDMLRSLPRQTPAMSVLRTAVSMLAAFDHDAEDLTDKQIASDKALRLTGQITTICAAWMRITKDLPPISPRVDLNLAQNFVT